MIKRNTLIWTCAAALALPSLFTFLYLKLSSDQTILASPREPIAPFTLHLQEKIKQGSLRGDPQFPTRVGRDIVIARRSDGARVEKVTYLPGTPQEHQQREVRLPEMRIVKTWDSIRRKTTGAPWSAASTERYHSLQPTGTSNCLKNALGQNVSAGYGFSAIERAGNLLAVKMTEQSGHQITTWRAPALGCEEVSRTIEFKGCCRSDQIDPRSATSDSSELILIGFEPGEPGEPAAELFATDNLTESAPGSAAETQLRASGQSEAHIQKARQAWKASDDSYWQSRAAAGIRPQ